MKILFLFMFLQSFCYTQIHGDRLKVTLFYESFCTGCQQFIIEQLYPSYKKIGSYIDVDLIPYGNTRREFINGTWNFDCQHGQKECTINKLEACGLAKSRNITQQLEFVYCVESNVNNSGINKLAECSDKIGLPADILLHCALGPEGSRLFGYLGDKQHAIEPNWHYVPWLTFNYKHDENTTLAALDNFLKIVCELLDNKPKECSKNNEIP